MRKLTLESLHVESFETTAAAPVSRGTVQAHAEAITGTTCDTYDRCQPTYDPGTCQPSYDPHTCQGTEDWMCCTLGCTRMYETCGVDYCWVEEPTLNCTA